MLGSFYTFCPSGKNQIQLNFRLAPHPTLELFSQLEPQLVAEAMLLLLVWFWGNVLGRQSR